MMKSLFLEDICEKITDGSHNPPKAVEHSKYLMLSSKNILDNNITFDKPRYLSEKDFFLENKRTNLKVGDVLLTIVGTVGRCAVVEELDRKITLQRSVAVLTPKKNLINSKYLMFVLQSFSDDLNKKARGVAQKGIYLKSIRKIKINLPPLIEQQRIVAKLDKGFEKIQNIKNQITEKSKLIIALKESIISQYTKSENNKTNLFWQRSSLSDLCKKYKDDIVDGPFGSNLKTKDYKEEGVPVLKIQHVKQFEINYLKPTYISNQKYNELIRHSFKKGDIVLTKLGKPLGAASIVQDINEGIIVADLVRIRIDPQKIDNEFLCFQLNSLHIRAEINSFTRGATRPRIKLDVIRTLKINYPHIQEQKNISKKLNKLLKEVSNLIKINKEIGNQLELLKLSILRNLL